MEQDLFTKLTKFDLALVDQLPSNAELVYSAKDPEWPILRRMAAQLFDVLERAVEQVHLSRFSRSTGNHDAHPYFISTAPVLGDKAGQLFERGLDRDALVRLVAQTEAAMLTPAGVPTLRAAALEAVALAADGCDVTVVDNDGHRVTLRLTLDQETSLRGALARRVEVPKTA